jgi:hypothetical protein
MDRLELSKVAHTRGKGGLEKLEFTDTNVGVGVGLDSAFGMFIR